MGSAALMRIRRRDFDLRPLRPLQRLAKPVKVLARSGERQLLLTGLQSSRSRFPQCHFNKNRTGEGPVRGEVPRGAFTLLEVILAMAIIVALAGLSWPQLSHILRRESLTANVEQVRRLLDRARVRAVEEGVIYQFRYEPHGRRFVLLPYELLATSPAEQAGNSFAPATPGFSNPLGRGRHTGAERPPIQVQELTEVCSFYVPTTLSGEPLSMERLADPYLQMVVNGPSYRDVTWGPPVLFYPDGSASEGAVSVADKDRRYVTLSIRGLTGTVITSRMDLLPELFGASTN